MMTRSACETLMRESLALSPADETLISLTALDSTTTSVGGGRLLPTSSLHNVRISVTVRKGSRYAMASTNVLSAAALARTLAEAVARTRLAEESPSLLPLPGGAAVQESPMNRFDAADVDAGWRRDSVRVLLDTAGSADLVPTGAVSTSNVVTAIASSNGLFLYQPASMANGELRVFTKDGLSTSFADQFVHRHLDLDPKAMAQRAVEGCLAWHSPERIKPERYTTIFDVPAMAEILLPFIRQFDEEAVLERRSFLLRLDGSTRVGQELLSRSVTLTSDPFDPDIPALPFGSDGTPIAARTWVRNGTIDSVARTAALAAHEQRETVAPPSNLIMAGGSETLDSLIAGTKRGVLVRRLTALNIEDPANCLLTGSSRDGLFLIEDGKITRPLQNMMLRETPIQMLKNVSGMTAAMAVWPRGLSFPMRVPAIRVPDVMWSSLSGVV